MKPNVLESYNNFWAQLPKNTEANLKFAQEIIKGKDPIHNFYFWGDYSKPILAYIITRALKYQYVDDDSMIEHTGDYHDFVAGPFDDGTHKPNWYQLKMYKGLNGKKLKGWLQEHGYQYFIAKKIADEEERKRKSGSIDKLPLNVLLCFDAVPEDLSDHDLKCLNCLKIAWDGLNEKDQETLRVLIIDKSHWTVAWGELNGYIDPEEDTEPMSEWSNKKKQDSIARLKRRAKEHLRNNFFNVYNNNL